ncbi:Multidrug efflux pump subunit AcrB [Pedobacter suwonensis]|uniref:Multidrug efflux pump subunit AcrB n=1 Tax=Pedobacter suwonensis TaxID=332999 RepID=A0A1I0TQW3_9SPHI|nr:efflux RND transporter permease subunit [Pedobacter suwonensis]SFA54138.1 Multidrug efflux pump subunit AcrB [Pedobacter suwonensis]
MSRDRAFSILILFGTLSIFGAVSGFYVLYGRDNAYNDGQINITFRYSGALPEVVEDQVTRKIEGLLATVSGLQEIRSVSGRGFGYLKAKVTDPEKLMQKRFEISTLMGQLYPGFPKKVSYPVTSVDRSDKSKLPLLSYVIPVNGFDNIEEFIKCNIQQPLLALKGISQVNIIGASKKNIEVGYRRNDLEKLSLTTGVLANNLANAEEGLGKVPDRTAGGQVFYRNLIVKKEENNVQNLSDFPIGISNGQIIPLHQVASVRINQSDDENILRIDGKQVRIVEIVADQKYHVLFTWMRIKQLVSVLQNKMPKGISVLLQYDEVAKKNTGLWRAIIQVLMAIAIVLLTVFVVFKRFNPILLTFLFITGALSISFLVYRLLGLKLDEYAYTGIVISVGMMMTNCMAVLISNLRGKIKNTSSGTLAINFATIAALSIIILPNSGFGNTYHGFAIVIMTSCVISTILAVILMPALIAYIKVEHSYSLKRKKAISHLGFINLYRHFVLHLLRFRILILFATVLLFGLPFFLLPEKINSDEGFAKFYNRLTAVPQYREHIKPFIDIALGGTLRLFWLQSNKDIQSDEETSETRIGINIEIAKGYAFSEIKEVVTDWEDYLSAFKEIRTFQSRIVDAEHAQMVIYFDESSDSTGFPMMFKKKLELKADENGLAEFAIYGVGEGFSTEVKTEKTNYAINLSGYNYEKMMLFAARVEDELKENERVNRIFFDQDMLSERNDSRLDYVMSPIKPKNEIIGLSAARLSRMLYDNYGDAETTIPYQSQLIQLRDVEEKPHLWDLQHQNLKSGSFGLRIGQVTVLQRSKSLSEINRLNQQYRVVVNYNFIGDAYLGKKVSDQIIEKISRQLPLGYSINDGQTDDLKQITRNRLLSFIYIVIIIFFACAIIFNSLRNALSVIVFIPLSLIGFFTSAYVFNCPLHDGGILPLILLSSMVVRAAVLLVNHFSIRKSSVFRPVNHYVKVVYRNLLLISLSIVSLIFSLLPTVFMQAKDIRNGVNWSIISGLVISVPAILVLLPLTLLKPAKRSTVQFITKSGSHD